MKQLFSLNVLYVNFMNWEHHKMIFVLWATNRLHKVANRFRCDRFLYVFSNKLFTIEICRFFTLRPRFQEIDEINLFFLFWNLLAENQISDEK